MNTEPFPNCKAESGSDHHPGRKPYMGPHGLALWLWEEGLR